MPYSYRVTLESLPPENFGMEGRTLTFEVTNHDELFGLMDRVALLGAVPETETAEFTIGLKLFSEVMLRHRRDPLFAEFFAQFGTFMKRLKSLPPAGPTQA